MKTQFDTEKEAKAALATAQCGNLGFCPEIDGSCKRDCVCYRKGDIHESNIPDKHWIVHYPCCNHVLISGEITVYVEY